MGEEAENGMGTGWVESCDLSMMRGVRGAVSSAWRQVEEEG